MTGILFTKPVRIAKRIVAELLINNTTGALIRTFSNKKITRQGSAMDITADNISNKTIAAFFFNSYESSERRFIKKYLRKDLPVIEVGSSLGIVSSVIAKHTTAPLFIVEANPALIPLIEKNLQLNNVSQYKIFNAAIGKRDQEQLHFLKGKTNLHGRVFSEEQKGTVPVKVISLSKLKAENQIGDFVLVSDIEGAEIFIFMDDNEAIKTCQQIIIETHDTQYNGEFYKYEQIKNLILSKGFQLMDSYGPNYVFKRAHEQN